MLKSLSLKKLEWSTLILSICFSFFMCSGYIYDKGVSGALGQHRYLTIFVFVCLTVCFYLLIKWLGGKELNRTEIKPVVWKVLPLILFLGWLPFLINFYPGSFSYDAAHQIRQFFHDEPLSNHNPVLDTWIFGILFKIGRFVTGGDNSAITFMVTIQMLLMAFTFTYGLYQGYQLTHSRSFVYVSAAFYAAIPQFGFAAHAVLKDSLHMQIVVFMIACQVSLFRKPTKFKCILYGLSVILVSLTRAMAVLYAGIGCVVFLLYFWKKKMALRKMVAAVVITALAFVILWENVFLNAIGVAKYPSVEKYAMPLFQIGYIVVNHDLTEEETDIINSFLDVDLIREKYDPDLVDQIKLMYHGDSTEPLWKIYRTWWKKYPGDMLKGFGRSYYKYIYPFSIGSRNTRLVVVNLSDIGIHTHSDRNKTRKQAIKDFLNMSWAKYTFLKLFYGPSLYLWIFLFGLQQCIRKRSRNIIHLIPLLILFIGLFLTPVNGEMRYTYPIFASVPLVIAMAYEVVEKTACLDSAERIENGTSES